MTQPRLAVPALKSSTSPVTSKIVGPPSTSGTAEKDAVVAASTSFALMPPPVLFHVARSVQSMIMRCDRNVSFESKSVPVTFRGV